MKTLTPAADTLINTLTGTEPFSVVVVEWSPGATSVYTDKDKIISINELSQVLTDSGPSSSLQIVLDDTDGTIKQQIDTKDCHKAKATVYQSFEGMDASDRFVIMRGRIMTPFTWGEKDRTVQFDISSEIDSFEVGFSPEEGQLDFVNPEFVGKPWPLVFGSPLHVPAQKTSNSLSGTTLDELCIPDQTLEWKLEQLRIGYFNEAYLMYFFRKVADGAFMLAPPVEDIITYYVQVLLEERQIMAVVYQQLAVCNRIEDLVAIGKDLKDDLLNERLKLDALSISSRAIQVKKEQAMRYVQMATFKYNTMKDANYKVVEAYRNMSKIYATRVEIQNQLCKESQCAVNSIRVQNGKNFPQNETLDLYINDVKFRGSFDGELFTFVDTPTAKLHDIEVAPWQLDDDACAPEDTTINGLNLFWLKEYVSLTGLYLLVKKRGTDELHVIKVERQVGLKVYFTLITWPDSTPEAGPSIDSAIGRLKEIPFVPTPWGGTLPADLFSNDWRESEWNQPQPARLLAIINAIPGGVNAEDFQNLAQLVFLAPHDKLGDLVIMDPTPRDIYTIVGEDIETILEASGMVHAAWLDHDIPYIEVPERLYWKATVGSNVRLATEDCALYICNILPSQIVQVSAYRTLENGSRILSPVPSQYYIKNEDANLGTINVTSLTFPTDLPNIAGEGWEGQPYVTLTSSVGPNVVDIIQHLIETYTSCTVDSSFATVKALFKDGDDELYPAHFALFDRPNVLTEINRIAYEARCALIRNGDVFSIVYLSAEPDSVRTIDTTKVDAESHYTMVFPNTDDVTTRCVASFKEDYLPSDYPDPKVVLRHNVSKYGMRSKDIEYHIYNDRSLVLKSATFWMIRDSNSWKELSFTTFLNNLDLEVLDCITIDLPGISNDPVKALIHGITYNTTDFTLSITVQCPVKIGEMDAYPFYWPANLAEDETFPTQVEIEDGYAGGFGPGSGVTGNIDDC